MDKQIQHRGKQRIWGLPRIDIQPFEEISDSRDVAVIYSAAALDAVKDRIRVPFTSKHEVTEATESHFRSLAEGVSGEVIYAIGGGVAVDAAKYVGQLKGLPVVSLPTAMTVDAFFTWAAGVRQDGCVSYLETGPPDRVVIDLQVLASAPESIRAAGICDVLSIATGSWDWRFARDRGKLTDETRYREWADRVASSILDAAFDCAEAAGRGDHEGLKQLADCLALEVQLCNQIGHSRPEEGSEHYFAYSVEHRLSQPLPHGDLVGPGILIAAHLQEQDTSRLKQALVQCRVPIDNIPDASVLETLEQLPDYAERHNLPFGIAHVVKEPTPDVLKILS